MATSTDCDFLTRKYINPTALDGMLADPDGPADLIHLTPHDEYNIYNAVDVSQHRSLTQAGNVVAITGASRGIGRGIAVQFAKAGAEAIAICARGEAGLEETKALILKTNPAIKVFVQKVDVTQTEDVRTFFANTVEKFGKVDVAVANAGANDIGVPLVMTEPESWWREQEVNYKSVYLVARYFAESLGEKTGTMINVSTNLALAALPTQASYGCAKLASVRLMETLHWEAPNIRAFSLHPGYVKSEMSQKHTMGGRIKWKFVDDELPGAVILYLTTEKAEYLRGRWISTNWNVEELEAMKGEIVEKNLLKTAFLPRLGV